MKRPAQSFTTAEEDDFTITRASHVLNPGDDAFLISKSEFIKAFEILTERKK